MLSKFRVFLVHFAGGKFVGDNYMKPAVFYPLPEFAIGEFFPFDVVHTGIPVRRSRRLCYFDRESRQSEAFDNQD